jgi:hypothetical protein
MRLRWLIGIVLAALIGSIVYDLTGSSELAYILRAIARGLS